MADFTIKQNDLRKDLKRQLVEDGAAVDLSTADSVEFHLNTKPEKGTNVVNGTATIVDAVNGIVEYEWTASDTDRDPGTYYFEFQVNWNNGDPQTFPNDPPFKALKITPEGA